MDRHINGLEPTGTWTEHECARTTGTLHPLLLSRPHPQPLTSSPIPLFITPPTYLIRSVLVGTRVEELPQAIDVAIQRRRHGGRPPGLNECMATVEV